MVLKYKAFLTARISAIPQQKILYFKSYKQNYLSNLVPDGFNSEYIFSHAHSHLVFLIILHICVQSRFQRNSCCGQPPSWWRRLGAAHSGRAVTHSHATRVTRCMLLIANDVVDKYPNKAEHQLTSSVRIKIYSKMIVNFATKKKQLSYFTIRITNKEQLISTIIE